MGGGVLVSCVKLARFGSYDPLVNIKYVTSKLELSSTVIIQLSYDNSLLLETLHD